MIPAAFTYYRPRTVPDALSLLGAHSEEARAIAGGHSLIPMMKLRLATPDHLVDLGAIAALKGIRAEGGAWVLGATTTQAELIAHAGLARALPILRETALQIADPQVRARGTVGGNVVNGDPGNDMPAVMLCLDAALEVAGRGGARTIRAREFYRGAFITALAAGEIVTAIRIPAPPAKAGAAYVKLKRKTGDYATAAAAAMLSLEGGRIATCAIALTNVAPTALLAEAAAAGLIGAAPGAAAFAAAAAAAEAITDPAADGHGPVDYRRRMAGVMVRRALAAAAERAGG